MRKTRNDIPIWYCLYSGSQEIIDENGRCTGQYILTYEEPVLMYANVSPATGAAQTEQFGHLENYDKVIVTMDMECPIDENSVLFIDKEPESTSAVTVNYKEAQALYGEPTVTPVTVQIPAFDYTVRRVAKSLNHIAIAVRKVTVS